MPPVPPAAMPGAMPSGSAGPAAPWSAGLDFDAAVLGHALPPGVEDALREAGAHRGEADRQGGAASGDAPRTMAALMRAQALAPDHPAVLIALYRHHFYGHRLAAARDVARRALRVGALALGLPELWREVPRRPLAGARDDAGTRFYLFTLKGYAYLSLRLDDGVEARDALALLRHLDPDDCVGGALVEAVRQRALVGDWDDDDDMGRDPAGLGRTTVPATGAAAWARLAPR